jgi:hypothetical protein
MGILMDAGVALEAQLSAMAAYCFIAAPWTGSLMPRLNRDGCQGGGEQPAGAGHGRPSNSDQHLVP